MQVFHGKSGSGSKFQYIIFEYRCVDIGLNARSLKPIGKSEESWCFKNEHFLFCCLVFLFCFVSFVSFVLYTNANAKMLKC